MNKNEIIIFETEDQQVKLPVNIDNETVWLTQAQMVELFQRDTSVISRHIKNVFKEEEVEEKAICIFCKLQILTNQLLFIVLMSSFLLDIE